MTYPVLNLASRHKDEWVSVTCLHAFLTSALDVDEWLASRPGSFTPREESVGTHWLGGWMGHKVGLGAMAMPTRSPVTTLTELDSTNFNIKL